MKIKKWLKYLLIALGVLTLTSIFLFQRTGKMIYGGLTQQVDPYQFEPKSGAFVITDIHVLSPDGTRFLPNQFVYFENGKIQRIDSVLTASEQFTTLDGAGKYLIPGLIDAHVHLFKSPNDLLLYVANGVTEIREMIGEKDHLSWKQEIEEGRIGPKMFVASPRMGSFEPLEGWFMEQSQGYINANNARDAAQIVKQLHKKGYDGIKIYSQLNKESYEAITQTAEALGIPTFGHIPWEVSLSDVWESGQSGIAHFEELMNALSREFGGFYGKEEAFLAFVEERSEELAGQLLQNDIAVTSTLWLTESFVRQKFELDQILQEVELPYQNPGISEWSSFIPGGLGWLPEVNRYKIREELSEEELAGRRRFWEAYAQACRVLTKELNEKGVSIMAGTDANLPPAVPGFSLHDELQSLNKAGMSAAETLQSATSVPAAWLKSNTGIIAPGYTANMVILDKNPLEDIQNTKAIHTVILKGQVFDRSLLDQLLSAVREANDASRKVALPQ